MITSSFYGFWEDWENRHKVTFDGINKLVLVNAGVTSLDVKEDIYSSWKEWVVMYDHGKFPPAVRAVGGDPTTGGNFLGSSYFLTNGWRMRTWEGDHRLSLTGNLFTQEGEPVFVPTLRPHTIEIAYSTSSLVEGFGYDVPSEYTPQEISNAVWLITRASVDSPGTLGRVLLDIDKKAKENQGLILSQ